MELTVMITVYRVENSKGIGPYWEVPYDIRPKWMREHNDCKFHPAPSNEWGYKGDALSPLIFGFTSLEQLYAWFEEDSRQWLQDHEFKLAVYSADEYEMLVGAFQCAFKRETAMKLEEREL